MKLTIKIMSLIFLGIITLLAIDGYLSVRREITLFDNDMKRNALLLGNTVKELTLDTWHTSGKKRALDLIKSVDKEKNHMRVRWVMIDAQSDNSLKPRISRTKLVSVLRGKSISIKKTNEEGPGHLYTYIPVRISKDKYGALEISESLSKLKNYIHETVERSIILGALMAMLGFTMLWVLGVKLVGKPLNQLMEMTRKVGDGDFSSRVIIQGSHELSSLADSMNQMCEQLSQAWKAVHKESEARIAALEQLRHAERLTTLGRLSSGIAHELGTPLNVVSGRAKLILTGELSREETMQCSEIIRAQSERMTQLIRELLDFARRRAPKKSPVDLKNLAGQVMEMLSSTAEKQFVTLNILKDSDIPLVSVDQFQIQQVIINLIMNGIQAMPDGGNLEIGLSKECSHPPEPGNSDEHNYVSLYIKDEGKGILKDNINHIFEPFFTTKDIGKGTGLGLSIAYGIVQEHGGWINVESKVGKGSCFTIFLPLEVDECVENS